MAMRSLVARAIRCVNAVAPPVVQFRFIVIHPSLACPILLCRFCLFGDAGVCNTRSLLMGQPAEKKP